MAHKWYIVNTYSGYEKRVAESIKEQVQKKNLQHLIEEVLIPTQKTLEIKRGKKVEGEKKFFPGYILVNMEMNDDSWHLIKQTTKVTDFLNASGKPAAITQDEADRILNQVQEGIESPLPTITFEIGETVRVADGPFASFNGVVEDVDVDRSRLKVAVSIFGRATPVELEYTQVEKA